MNSNPSGAQIHVLLVSFPGQGHVNPLLRLGKYLASKGLFITFSTPEFFGKQMRKANNFTTEPIPVGNGLIKFEFFEDGWDEDDSRRLDPDLYLNQLEHKGKQALFHMINEEKGHPISCIINNPFLPWVIDVAESLGIPSAVLWVQSCACFSAYYHYYHDKVKFPSEIEPELDVQMPCLPVLKYDEIPSFLHPFTPYPFFKRAILGQYRNLSTPFCILMDTFQELEYDLIKYMSSLYPIKPVGPLFRNPESRGSSVRGDIMKAEENCIKWLNSKPLSSVVYLSFGTIVCLKQEQVNELANGILSSGVSFLWVLKPPIENSGFEPVVLPEDFLEKAGDKGKVVEWSPQEEVLAHSSVSCFVTHCGWNSSMEALTNGVPVVTFPQWGDQVTNAKYLVDEFGVGIRLCRGEAEKKIIRGDEVEKCLREATSGAKAMEMKENALKWKKKAEEAVAEGGSSDRNMQEFVEEIKRRSVY